MIFEIEILLHEFKRDKIEKPSDINLMFIEEPEAHTHPQMQYVFIKNIKNLLKGGIIGHNGERRKLQYIITTHSSHIVVESKFDGIKYFKKDRNNVIAKNLKDLEYEYDKDGESQNFKFLKQYLTLHRSELFFADKAIFIEGDTERILLPAMMKKIDQDEPKNPLLSQNISIVEVGAYSHIFEKFIDFIGVKSLIITDIDSGYDTILFETDGITPQKHKNGSIKTELIKCPVSDSSSSYTSNASLKFFHDDISDISYYKDLKFEWKILRKKKKIVNKWVSNKKGNLLTIYQTEEDGYHSRSFEDAFFHLNRQFIVDNKEQFNSLVNKKYLRNVK